MAPVKTTLPQVESERIINEAVRRMQGQFGQLLGLNIGSISPSTGIASYTPTLIDVGETFTVPVNKQVLFALTITVHGSLVVDGSLVMVN